MPLLTLKDCSLNYGSHILLDSVSLTLEKGMKIGLLGRNGAGKSTLLKVISAAIQVDSGQRWLQPGAEVAVLEQELPDANELSVYDVVASGLAELGELLSQFHHLVNDENGPDIDRLQRVQNEMDARSAWSLGQRVDAVISQLQLPPDTLMKELSGGWRRRVALAKALVREPDLLLLDEPTNHLDIVTIEWLEKQLRSFQGSLIVISHDRAFLQKVANHIAELDRGHLFLVKQTFRGFLEYRQQQLDAESEANARFDKKLAQEEVWIRKGIQARRTRNEGRVRALKAMREEHSQRRKQQGNARFGLDSAAGSGKVVVELSDVSHCYGDNKVIDAFSCLVQRGDRIGLVGPNGAGKTTLIKIMMGELAATTGKVKLGSKMEVVYFDQLRQQLDPNKTLLDSVCGGRTHIEIGGKLKHAVSYLNEFLFSPDRIHTPVRALSGGEQNRAILAILFSKPANILVLDEPTNDLDIETLELLEEILLSFKGTILLVSHDREFMDKVVTSILVFAGNGKIEEQAGGFQDWVDRGGSFASLQNFGDAGETYAGKQAPRSVGKPPAEISADKSSSVPAISSQASKKKLSYKDKKELAELPSTIESLEEELETQQQLISEASFYDQGKDEIQTVMEGISRLQARLDAAYARWEYLDSQA